MFTPEHLLELLIMGWLANVPLAIGSILSLSIFFERISKFRGLEASSRQLASEVIDALAKRDRERAEEICKASDLPVAGMLLEGMRWKNVSIEDLDHILSTLRAELSSGLRRNVWIIGTTGSLAPFVGLFGTVIGIIRSFAAMAEAGSSGFAVVSQGISEALVATAAGLGVAIVALLFFNYVQVRAQAISSTYGRAAERLIQALLYVETSSTPASGGDA